MWDLPRPGLEPVSPALAGRLSTTAPPGKPLFFFLKKDQECFKSFVLLLIEILGQIKEFTKFFKVLRKIGKNLFCNSTSVALLST